MAIILLPFFALTFISLYILKLKMRTPLEATLALLIFPLNPSFLWEILKEKRQRDLKKAQGIDTKPNLFFKFVISVLARTLYRIRVKLELKKQEIESLKSEISVLQRESEKESLVLEKKVKLFEKKFADELLQKEAMMEELLKIKSKTSPLENKQFLRKFMRSVVTEASMRAHIINLEKHVRDLEGKDSIKEIGSTSGEIEAKELDFTLNDKKIESKGLKEIKGSELQLSRADSNKSLLMRTKSNNVLVNEEKSRKSSLLSKTRSYSESIEKSDTEETEKEPSEDIQYQLKSNSLQMSAQNILRGMEKLDLFGSLVISSKKVIEVLSNCAETEISQNAILLASSLKETPIWLNHFRVQTLSVITDRIKGSAFLQQTFYYALNSGLIDQHLFKAPILSDSMDLYNGLLIKKRKKGFKLVVEEGKTALHPFKVAKIKSIGVKKVIKSNTRPLLLRLKCEKSTGTGHDSSFLILKNGNDMRRDMAVMQIFKLMNALWKAEPSSFEKGAIEAVTYNVVAIGPSTGLIEYVLNTFPIVELKKHQKKFGQREIQRQINTAAGGTIASFLLGIKDRHDDNTLFCDNGDIFQIDFSYMMGDKVTVETAEISITRDTKRHFGVKGWKKFIDACVRAYCTLRNNKEILIEYCKLILSPLYSSYRVEIHLKQTLMLNLSFPAAVKHLRSMLKKAPSSYRTRFKNVLHHTAQAFKKGEEDEFSLSASRKEE